MENNQHHVETAVRPETRLCIVETPSNPALDLIDLEWLGDFCSERDITLVVDNVFATPVLQQPILYGADLVMHSATKYMDGHGRGIGGGLAQGRRFLDALQLCSLTANLGDTRTIATHPASTTHSALTEAQRQEVGITPGLIRISVGLENVADIKADIAQALYASPE